MTTNQPLPSVESPCIKKCCLDVNDVCLGCFRSLEEITKWTQANKQTRLAFLENAKARQKQLSLP